MEDILEPQDSPQQEMTDELHDDDDWDDLLDDWDDLFDDWDD